MKMAYSLVNLKTKLLENICKQKYIDGLIP